MQNFDPERLMQAFDDLKAHVARHIPVGEGTEDRLADRVTALEDDVAKLMRRVFDVAGIGATEAAATLVPVSEYEGNGDGNYGTVLHTGDPTVKAADLPVIENKGLQAGNV